jgi:tetratricopeptide (TPR) repeat protein/predicted Ser/Thr protein kinase
MIPKVVSHYRLLNHLGEGGMGVVYRAEDLRLGREVAIKLLRTEAIASSEWLARFEREARLASSLQHPHICTIHELGEHEGQPFIAMELLEGRTIRQIAESGPLPADRVLDFACQIASALDAAHRRGIVHRDIKPANLFVTHGERLKVLDFGLAKMAGDEPVGGHTPSSPTLPSVMASDLTRTGSTVGTASYMAPEQAQGEPVDARTDLFSLGSVLYEMATGRRAFGGDDIPLIVMKIINGIVVPPRSVNAAVPEDLERIIQRLMAVNPADRFQTAGELLAELQRVIHVREHGAGETPGSGPQTIAAAPARARRRWAAAAAIGFIILAAGAGAAWRARRPPALTDRDSILIAGFENTTANTMFDATLLTALKAHLGQSPFLDIISDQRIRETLESMSRSADEALTHETAREVCQRMSVKAMLEGAVAPLGTHFVVTLNATDCQTGSSLARLQAEASSPERVLTELGTLSSSMRTALGESLPSVQRFDVPIEQATTPSLAALKAYTLGLEERRRGRELESVAFFNQAIEIDPEFVAAYTTLSTVYGSVGEWRRSEDYARLANNVTRRMSERERLFVTYQFHDRVSGNQQRAAETLEIWKASYPRDFRPVNALALIHNRAGQYEKAEAEAKEALRRSPGHPFPLSNLAFAYRAMGRYEDARRTAEEAVSLGVETTPTRRLLYQVGLVMGDGSAFQHLTWARGKPREFDLISAQAQAAAYHGRLREALELYQRASYMARARDLQGTAAGYDAHLAFTEALLRPRQEAIADVKRLLRGVHDEENLGGTVPRFRIAVALGLLGQTAEAQALMGQAQQRYPDSTFVRTVVTPSARAAIALAGGRPDAALTALEAAVPSQSGTVAGLVPFYLRAEALMLKGSIPDAVAEYENILKHRGVDPFAPVVPLAHLGIARARAVIGDVEGSRRAYDALFTAWKGADEDLPLLAAARAEYGRVTTTPATMASSGR